MQSHNTAQWAWHPFNKDRPKWKSISNLSATICPTEHHLTDFLHCEYQSHWAAKHEANGLVSSCQRNAHFLYSITIYMLHYNPQHDSSSTLLILRGTNCIIAASGIVTHCKRPYSMPVESGLSPLATSIRLQWVTIPEAAIIQFVLLRMSKVLLETCWRL